MNKQERLFINRLCIGLEPPRFKKYLKKDGGPGSGNHGHAGVPGQVGGSAPGPFGKLSDDAVAIIKAHLNSPMHFGETDEQKAASQKTLVESLKKSGISVSYDEDK